jgi:sporulation protein YqfC
MLIPANAPSPIHNRCPFIFFTSKESMQTRAHPFISYHKRSEGMKGMEPIFARLTDKADLTGEPVPGQTVVEIAGENRVLIENYCAVREYSPQRIGVRVAFGTVVIEGCALELRRMTKEQLVIFGRIDAVSLQRRG